MKPVQELFTVFSFTNRPESREAWSVPLVYFLCDVIASGVRVRIVALVWGRDWNLPDQHRGVYCTLDVVNDLLP